MWGGLLRTACPARRIGAWAPAQSNLLVGYDGYMPHKARGTFVVKLTPQAADDYFDGASLNRLWIDKAFSGDLQGHSKGQMMSALTEVKGSAGYVAIERVSGTLHGRTGAFVLQHSSTMNQGEPQQSIGVVPDSGTDQLKGLSGSMVISVVGGKHYYDFEYTLSE